MYYPNINVSCFGVFPFLSRRTMQSIAISMDGEIGKQPAWLPTPGLESCSLGQGFGMLRMQRSQPLPYKGKPKVSEDYFRFWSRKSEGLCLQRPTCRLYMRSLRCAFDGARIGRCRRGKLPSVKHLFLCREAGMCRTWSTPLGS